MDDQTNHLDNLKREIRRLEKQERRRHKGEICMGLRAELAAKLPPNLIPGNVGNIDEVRWNYDFPVRFQISVGETTFGQAFRKSAFFQVPQEAALVLTHCAVNFEPLAGSANTPALAPLMVEIRDRQSSRQFMSQPMPIQAFGSGKYPTALPANMIFMPSAFVDTTISSFADGSYDYSSMTGYVNFVFYGVRIRIKDAKEILGSTYG